MSFRFSVHECRLLAPTTVPPTTWQICSRSSVSSSTATKNFPKELLRWRQEFNQTAYQVINLYYLLLLLLLLFQEDLRKAGQLSAVPNSGRDQGASTSPALIDSTNRELLKTQFTFLFLLRKTYTKISA